MLTSHLDTQPGEARSWPKVALGIVSTQPAQVLSLRRLHVCVHHWLLLPDSLHAPRHPYSLCGVWMESRDPESSTGWRANHSSPTLLHVPHAPHPASNPSPAPCQLSFTPQHCSPVDIYLYVCPSLTRRKHPPRHDPRKGWGQGFLSLLLPAESHVKNRSWPRAGCQ